MMRVMPTLSRSGLGLTLLAAFGLPLPAQRQNQVLERPMRPVESVSHHPAPPLAVFLFPTPFQVSGYPVPSVSLLTPVTFTNRTLSGALTDIVVTPRKQTGCVDDLVTFGVIAAPAGSSFEWRKNGTQIVPAETGSTLVLGPLTAADAGAYDVVVTSGNQTLVSHDGVLAVAGDPVITSQPQDRVVHGSVPVLFSVTATGQNLTYQWRFRPQIPQGSPFEDIPGATNPTLFIESAEPSMVGAYRCIVKNQCGTVGSKSARLTFL